MFFTVGLGSNVEAGEGLAHRLCKFALKTINEDMCKVFDKFVPIFDQDPSELQQQGETHQQYAAYKEYVDILEQHLIRFAAQEGYGGGDAAEFLAALRQTVAEDKANAERQFRKTWEALKNQFTEIHDDLGANGDAMLEQLRDFYKPPTVEDLMQTVLNITEYEAFSHLMRAKVHKVNLMAEMQRRKDEMMYGEMGLAHRFIQFAMKVLNRELEPFYQKCMPLFRQDEREFEQHGHTIEQFIAFQEFVQLLEGHFNSFIAREGFLDNAMGFIMELQRLAQKDQERLDADLQKTIAEVKKRHDIRQSSTGCSDGETNLPPEPVILIVKPQSICDLIDYFVHYTEYTTFSCMMRGRVFEEALFKNLFTAQPEDEPLQDVPHISPQGMPLKIEPSTHSTLKFEPPCRRQDQQQVTGASSISIAVAAGCQAGSQVTVPTPDGQSITATSPTGLSLGMSFEVPYTSAQANVASSFAVMVPEGCASGWQLTVNTPDGQPLVVTVPEGLSPGNTFNAFYVPRANSSAYH